MGVLYSDEGYKTAVATNPSLRQKWKKILGGFRCAEYPERRADVLCEDYMVRDMKPGSVIVHLAALGGGNCQFTRRGEKYMNPEGVTIVGYDNFPSFMAAQSLAMYAQNMLNLVKLRSLIGARFPVVFLIFPYFCLSQA